MIKGITDIEMPEIQIMTLLNLQPTETRTGAEIDMSGRSEPAIRTPSIDHETKLARLFGHKKEAYLLANIRIEFNHAGGEEPAEKPSILAAAGAEHLIMIWYRRGPAQSIPCLLKSEKTL